MGEVGEMGEMVAGQGTESEAEAWVKLYLKSAKGDSDLGHNPGEKILHHQGKAADRNSCFNFDRNSFQKSNCCHNNLSQLPLFAQTNVEENSTMPNRFVLALSLRGQLHEATRSLRPA